MRYGAYYNRETIGDILMIIFCPNVYPNKVKKSGDVVGLYRDSTLLGYNIYNISNYVKIHTDGFIPMMNHEVIDVINYILKNASFESINYQEDSGYKIVRINSIEEHPSSEHLHVLTVDDGVTKDLQIVCGSSNVSLGIKVVLATVSSFLPNGQTIEDGKILGVESHGMLCSGIDLNLKGPLYKSGLLIVDDSYKLGDDFYR